ncbi:hypothetical protein CMV30_05830 [Nibricoccus aquaticus]|uniref:DUF3592 domain-containing protein n=1 Tax=Nibricoccus aquaticus TaxID=2576891 RepID=A0A290QI15_9BACT|nr:DUF3592 domain-containing protein [Nibricoccus aquaticus]ATC63512.1 hypothetical protein CMV30_05830 [Nibricoccus aquaticus]
MSDLAKPLTEKPGPPELWAAIAIIAVIFALAASISIPSNTTAWKNAEYALAHWQPTPARVEHVSRYFKKRFYATYSGSYVFQSKKHLFQTKKFEESGLSRAIGKTPYEGSDVTVHVNPANPSESLFEASAQRDLFRAETMDARYLATSGGILCVLGIAMHIRDRRRFARESRA